MKFVKIVFAITLLCLLAATPSQAQGGMVKKQTAATNTEKSETFTVLGNCGMCESIIEKSAAKAGAVKADWDMNTDQLTVSYDPAQTSVDAIQKAIALAGYDNAGYKAPDDVYEKLHACCHYDRSGAPNTAKPCTGEQ